MINAMFDRRCAELYQRERLSTHAIARRLKSSQGRVAQALRREGVARRWFNEAVKLAWAQKREQRKNGKAGKD